MRWPGIYLLYIAPFLSHVDLATGNRHQVCYTNPRFSGYMVDHCPDGWTIMSKRYIFRKHHPDNVKVRPNLPEVSAEGDDLEEGDIDEKSEVKPGWRKVHRITKPIRGGDYPRSEINEARKDTRKATTVTNIVGGKHHKKKLRDNDGPVRGHVSTKYSRESDETEEDFESSEEDSYSYEDESPEIPTKKVTKITKLTKGKISNKEGGKDSGDTRKHTTTRTVVEGKLKGEKSHSRGSTSRRGQYAARHHVTPTSDEELSYESGEQESGNTPSGHRKVTKITTTGSRTNSELVSGKGRSITKVLVAEEDDHKPVAFYPVYAMRDPGSGIGGYDLQGASDRIIAFDYDHSGKQDHLILFRPGIGLFKILKNTNGTFTSIYDKGPPGEYDLMSPNDRMFAYDYESSGKLDYLVMYRPGGKRVWILKNTDGTFTAVYGYDTRINPVGIAGFDFSNEVDRAMAFDFTHNGKMDHIVVSRPGSGVCSILKNENGNFVLVYGKPDEAKGIGGFDFMGPGDAAFAYDYDNSGKSDHLVVYRPGAGSIMILRNKDGVFSPVYSQVDAAGNGNGIGGFDLKRPYDKMFPFDFAGVGKQNYIVGYRPNTGRVCIIKHKSGNFTPIYDEKDPGGNGIGGWDMKREWDRGLAFDYDHTGKSDDLIFYRPGYGGIFIIKNNRTIRESHSKGSIGEEVIETVVTKVVEESV